jgi:hypothetical protein
MATPAPTKALGTPLEPFDSSSTKAKAFWTNLANYYYLNNDLYSTPSQKITSALTHFKLSTVEVSMAGINRAPIRVLERVVPAHRLSIGPSSISDRTTTYIDIQ